MIKIVLTLFYTRVLDVIILSWVATVDQTQLTAHQDNSARVIKFIFIVFAFATACYERIYREEMTENFTHMPKIAED